MDRPQMSSLAKNRCSVYSSGIFSPLRLHCFCQVKIKDTLFSFSPFFSRRTRDVRPPRSIVDSIIDCENAVESEDDMNFKQFYLGCLSHASYYIGSEGEAAVIDPQRDVQQYLD